MAENVFILGAGASKAAGGPLMKEFLDAARDIHANGRSGDFKDDFDVVFSAISSLQLVHSKAELDLVNLEAVFGIFEMARLLNRFPGRSVADIQQLVPSMRRVIYKTLQRRMTFPIGERGAVPDNTYELFVKDVIQPHRGRVAIITFNYDVALDYAIEHAGESPDYGIADQSGNTPLLKLHGSLNWSQCNRCKTIRSAPIQTNLVKNVAAQVTVGGDRALRMELECAIFDPFRNLVQCCGELSGTEPVIVPPTWDKSEYRSGLQRVWERAAKELSDATSITVIGYSMPDSDMFFKYLYGLGTVGVSMLRSFRVFDPDGSTEHRFRSLLGPGARARFQYEPKTFFDAIGMIR